MSFILSIETSAALCSVALHEDGKKLLFLEHDTPNAHASRLTLLIQDLLQKAGCGYKHLDAVAVSAGPGSYTGLRIGTATAKGICFAMSIPLLAINTLEVMAHHARALLNAGGQTSSDTPIVAVLDARREEVYSQAFSGTLMKQSEPLIWDTTQAPTHFDISSDFILAGNGAGKARNAFLEGTDRAQLLEAAIPHAKHMGSIAYQKYLREEKESLAYFEPSYLREFYVTTPKQKI